VILGRRRQTTQGAVKFDAIPAQSTARPRQRVAGARVANRESQFLTLQRSERQSPGLVLAGRVVFGHLDDKPRRVLSTVLEEPALMSRRPGMVDRRVEVLGQTVCGTQRCLGGQQLQFKAGPLRNGHRRSSCREIYWSVSDDAIPRHEAEDLIAPSAARRPHNREGGSPRSFISGTRVCGCSARSFLGLPTSSPC
jgi:hypothetical protein